MTNLILLIFDFRAGTMCKVMILFGRMIFIIVDK